MLRPLHATPYLNTVLSQAGKANKNDPGFQDPDITGMTGSHSPDQTNGIKDMHSEGPEIKRHRDQRYGDQKHGDQKHSVFRGLMPEQGRPHLAQCFDWFLMYCDTFSIQDSLKLSTGPIPGHTYTDCTAFLNRLSGWILMDPGEFLKTQHR